jgi:xanthine dehydrogenase YagT iron-sulfur-binding subunit
MTQEQPRRGVSRRSFLQTAGLSAAAASLGSAAETLAKQNAAQESGAAVIGPDPAAISLNINGRDVAMTIDPATTLLEALRVHAGLTGSKEICDRGSCGGCSVAIDGKLIASCLMLAIDAVGSKITTVEGLAQGDRLDPIQEAFIRHDALQCGYCTPGLIMASWVLLKQNAKPNLGDIKRGLAGNICRCGTYTNIFNAVLEASGQPPIMDSKGI